MTIFWFLRLEFHQAYGSAYDSNFRFSLVLRLQLWLCHWWKPALRKLKPLHVTHSLMDVLNCALKRPINISLQANEKYIGDIEWPTNVYMIKHKLQEKIFTLSDFCSISSLLTRLGCNNSIFITLESFLVFFIFFKIFSSEKNDSKTNFSGQWRLLNLLHAFFTECLCRSSILPFVKFGTLGGALASWLLHITCLWIKLAGFKPWPRTLCCVIGQDRCINGYQWT